VILNSRHITLHRYKHTVLCHQDKARSQDANGGRGLKMWTVAVILLSKQSETAKNWWLSSLVIVRGANNFSQ